MRLPKQGPGYRQLTRYDIECVLEAATPEVALAIKLGFYTGQRIGDCVKMPWSQFDGEAKSQVYSAMIHPRAVSEWNSPKNG